MCSPLLYLLSCYFIFYLFDYSFVDCRLPCHKNCIVQNGLEPVTIKHFDSDLTLTCNVIFVWDLGMNSLHRVDFTSYRCCVHVAFNSHLLPTNDKAFHKAQRCRGVYRAARPPQDVSPSGRSSPPRAWYCISSVGVFSLSCGRSVSYRLPAPGTFLMPLELVDNDISALVTSILRVCRPLSSTHRFCVWRLEVFLPAVYTSALKL